MSEVRTAAKMVGAPQTDEMKELMEVLIGGGAEVTIRNGVAYDGNGQQFPDGAYVVVGITG